MTVTDLAPAEAVVHLRERYRADFVVVNGENAAGGFGITETAPVRGRSRPMTTSVETREWRRYGFGGPPEPWQHDAQRDIDRLSTSYYLDILELRRQIVAMRGKGNKWKAIAAALDGSPHWYTGVISSPWRSA